LDRPLARLFIHLLTAISRRGSSHRRGSTDGNGATAEIPVSGADGCRHSVQLSPGFSPVCSASRSARRMGRFCRHGANDSVLSWVAARCVGRAGDSPPDCLPNFWRLHNRATQGLAVRLLSWKIVLENDNQILQKFAIVIYARVVHHDLGGVPKEEYKRS
jgi:hypothetical protein